MTDLGAALNDYTDTVLSAIVPLGIVAVIALCVILLVFGAARR